MGGKDTQSNEAAGESAQQSGGPEQTTTGSDNTPQGGRMSNDPCPECKESPVTVKGKKDGTPDSRKINNQLWDIKTSQYGPGFDPNNFTSAAGSGRMTAQLLEHMNYALHVNGQTKQWSHSECEGRCHGIPGMGDRQFLPAEVQEELAGAIVVVFVTIPVSGGLAAITTTGQVIVLSVRAVNALRTARTAMVVKTVAGAQKVRAAATAGAATALSSPVVTNPVIYQNTVDFFMSLPEGPPEQSYGGLLGSQVGGFVRDEILR